MVYCLFLVLVAYFHYAHGNTKIVVNLQIIEQGGYSHEILCVYDHYCTQYKYTHNKTGLKFYWTRIIIKGPR